MKFVANRINQTHLRDILPVVSEKVPLDNVLVVIAYGSSASDESQGLIDHVVEKKLRLDLWVRYDHSITVPLLKWLLKHLSDNVFTNFVPELFHSNVIWWKVGGFES
jgi:hypothetical protein